MGSKRLRHVWTPEEDAVLRAQLREGTKIRDIAAQIGVTKKSATNRMQLLGLHSPRMQRWTTAQIRRARELYDVGYCPREIAEKIGRRRDAVRAILGRHGGLVQGRQAVHNRRSDTRVYELRQRGLTFAEILMITQGHTTPYRAQTLAGWFRRYCARAELPVPRVPKRNGIRADLVAAERQRLGLNRAAL